MNGVVEVSPVYGYVIFAYLALMLGLGIYLARKVQNEESYYLANRSMSAPVTGFSFSVTQMSAGSLVGMIGVLGTLGYNYAPVAIASAAAPWAAFMIIGERIRRIADKSGAMTYGDIFEQRFDKSVKLLFGVMVILFIVPLITGQLQASGSILQVVLGMDYTLGVFLTTIVIVLYVVLSGMFGVAWSDFIQGVIMCVGVIFMVPAVISQAGGLVEGHAALRAIDPNLVQMTGLVTGMWVFSNVITWSLFQVGGNPHSMFRFLIPKNLRTLRKAMLWAVGANIIIFGGLTFVGTLSRVVLPDLAQRDLTMPILATEYLPVFVGSLLLAAVIAAIMSTVDSILLLVSSAATRDIYPVLAKGKTSPKKQLLLARIVTVVVGGVGLYVALNPLDMVQWMVALSFQLMAATLFIPIVLMCWWPRFNKAGALAGMLGGAATAVVWFAVGWVQYGSFSNWPGGIWPALLGIIVSGILAVVVTKTTKEPPKEVVEAFYS